MLLDEETVRLVYIPTDTDTVANLLVDYSNDWEESLSFLVRVADSRGIHINAHAIEQKVRHLIGEI